MTEKLTIQFGDVFIPSLKTGCEPDERFVIISVNEGGCLSAAEVKTEEGKLLIGIPGTTGREDIGEITGKLSLEQVLEGFRNNLSDTTPEGTFYDLVRQAAALGPITLPPPPSL